MSNSIRAETRMRRYDEAPEQGGGIPSGRSEGSTLTGVEREDEDYFEDVPMEGLNRLPKRPGADRDTVSEVPKQRQAFYKSTKSATRPRAKRKADENSLFVSEDVEAHQEEQWEDSPAI